MAGTLTPEIEKAVASGSLSRDGTDTKYMSLSRAAGSPRLGYQIEGREEDEGGTVEANGQWACQPAR